MLTSTVGYETHSFAEPLKRMAVDLWGPSARTDRDKLQRLGVAVRDIDPDTWARLFVQKLNVPQLGYLGPRSPVVCDDLRFENEWFTLKAEGFVIVRVVTDVSTRVDRLKGNGKWQGRAQLEHESETAVDHLTADHTIRNDIDIDAFNDRIIDIVIQERGRR